MPVPRAMRSRWRRGFLGLYALRMMSREPIYIHQVVTRIAERTQGAWHPSAGAIYPSVRSLVDQGFAEAKRMSGRRRFVITGAGRRRLARFRS